MQTQIESRLENRRTKVLKLMALAVSDRNPTKYIQGSFILGEIEARINECNSFRNVFINQLRQQA
jgi:arginine exporter protein ArgO